MSTARKGDVGEESCFGLDFNDAIRKLIRIRMRISMIIIKN